MKRTISVIFALAMTGSGWLTSLEAAEVETRTVSLPDCIAMALERNLDVRIQRLAPEIARYSLSGSYSGYEPTFSASMRHSSSTTPGGFDEQNRPYASSQSEANEVSFGLRGLLPTGTRYDFLASMSDTFGVRPGFAQDFANPIFRTTTLTNLRDGYVFEYGNVDYPLLPVADRFSNARAWTGVQLTQPLLKNFWIDATRLNIQLRKKGVETSELTLLNQIITTVTSVELAYYELIAARETIAVAEVALQLAEQLLRENRKRVEVGVMAPLDEKEAESQVAASRATLLGAKNAYDTRQRLLKSLLDDQFVAWHEVELIPREELGADPATFSLQDSWSKGIALRPDLRQGKIDLETRNITLKYDKNQLFPQLDLVGSYGHSGSSAELTGAWDAVRDASGPAYSFGAVLSVPLGNRDARSRYRISRVEIEQSLLRLKQLEQRAMVEIADAIGSARSSYEQVRATKEAADFAEQALLAEQKKLENGKSTSFQVLQLQRTLTTRAYENIRARVDYNASLARLAESEGSTLERNQISLESR